LRPAIAEVFVKIEDKKDDQIEEEFRVVLRELKIETSLAQSLRWIQDDAVAYQLLTDRRAFAGCYVVKPDLGDLYAYRMERIICKGLTIDNDNKIYVFPTFIFDHN
jgi:hypothetical protein